MRRRRDLAHDWREADLLVVDFEATSADPATARPLSVGWVVVRGGRLRCADAGYTLVRHHGDVPAAGLLVHRLTPDQVAEGADPAEVGERLRAVADGAVLVAHGAALERALLAGLGVPEPRAVVDTLGLVRRLDDRAGRHGADPRLSAAASRFGVPAAAAHHAFGDAWTTALLLLTVAGAREAARGACTLEDLVLLGRR